MENHHPVRVLLVDDDEDDHFMFRDLLAQVPLGKFNIQDAYTFEQGRKALADGEIDVCFLDYRLGPKTGIDFLKEALAEGCRIPMILLTGFGEQAVDLEAMQVGAADYLVKDQVNALLLERSIRYAIHRARALQEVFDREAQILVQDRLASVGLLASSLAHEIGNPLGIIRGRAERIESQAAPESDAKKDAGVIVAQIDRVSHLIRSLLNLARGDSSRQVQAVNLGVVLGEVLDLLAHELRRSSINLQNDLAGDSKIMVRAEPGPLHQVLLNLLVNSTHAIETAQKNGRTENTITIGTEALEGNLIALVVRDTGCGISAANLKNMFKPFFTTKEIGKGTGLGLATSYRIVEGWGGTIEVRSAEGQWTEFRIVLAKA